MKCSFLKIGLLALSLAAPSLGAQHSDVVSPSAKADGCEFSEHFGQRFIVADFNNDQMPDSISVRSLGQRGGKNTFRVHVCASGRTVSMLTIDSSDPSITLTAFDVNQDHSPDIVVEQLYTHKRIQVWLNDGHGGFYKTHADAFRNPDTRAPCTVSTPSNERHNSPRRAHLRRGTKLSIQRAKLPTTSRYSPLRNVRSLTAQVQLGLGGPNLSRAPPVALNL